MITIYFPGWKIRT